MADWDSADLLARVKRFAATPPVDEDMQDVDWYALLTAAEAHWLPQFATHFPWLLCTAPTLMLTADGGQTYTFPAGVTPLAVQLFDALGGRLMRPSSYWDKSGDYVFEGARIRFPANDTRSFPDGAPYARYVLPPGAIDGATESQLQPAYARELLVFRALVEWATRPNSLSDPDRWEAREGKLWAGEPAKGNGGILLALKQQNPFYGATAYQTGVPSTSFAHLATVAGYAAL